MGNELKNEHLGAKWSLVVCLAWEFGEVVTARYSWVIGNNRSCPMCLPEDSRVQVHQDLVKVKEILWCLPFSIQLADSQDHSFLPRTAQTALQLHSDVYSDHPKIEMLQRLWQFDLWSYLASLFLYKAPCRAACGCETCDASPGFSCGRTWEEERSWHGDIWMWGPDMS